MLIGFIKHNRSLSVVVLPIALIALWAYGFFHPVVPLTEHSAPLYKLIITGIEGFPFLITLISFILIFCEALLINYIIQKNEIINSNSFLPALVYMVLMSLQPEMFSLHPIVITNLFMLFALHTLMQSYKKETSYAQAFDTGLFISLSAMFYIPSIVFILLLWIGLLLLRPFIWREWVISFIGLIVPWIFIFFYYFWNGKLDALEYDAVYYTLITPKKSFNSLNFSYAEYTQIGILLLALFFSSGRFLSDLSKGTVRTRSNLFLLMYFFLLAFVSIFIAPAYSIAYLSFLSVPFTVFFSSFLLFVKKQWMADLLFLLLIISVFLNQFIN
ncbi:MAG: hypothetical protein HY841_15360 [Bacteroidetes bacterium]|nr:hypothetical protein [Bacteroidota bacterium]